MMLMVIMMVMVIMWMHHSLDHGYILQNSVKHWGLLTLLTVVEYLRILPQILEIVSISTILQASLASPKICWA